MVSPVSPLYSRQDVLALYDPQSIAVIGASARAGSFGGRTLENLADFTGRLYSVNEKYIDINRMQCYPNVGALPESPDLAVLTTPATSVETLLEDCIQAGVRAVMVYASGFAEMGDDQAIAAQTRLAARARQAGVRLLGPNCVGLMNYRTQARISFATTPKGALTKGPAIGLVVQSGALGFALAQAKDRGVNFSHVLTCGNSADVDAADWVSALAEDPDCNVIACAFEGLADPLKFKRAADKARQWNKPLIVYKLATGEEGAAAAMSHTASLAGSALLWQAVFDDAGAVTVLDFDALVETSVFFAKSPPAKAEGLAVLSGSGGAAIMAADFAEDLGVPIPQPSEPVVKRLRELIPPYVPARNPCDVTAGVINDRDTLIACADALMGDDRYGALIYGYTYAYDTATERLPYLSAVAAKHGKPLIYVWLTQLGEGPGTIQAEQDPNVSVIRSMRRAMEILRKWQAWGAGASDHKAPSITDQEAETKCRAQIADLRRDHRGALSEALGEAASKSLLSHYGIEVTQDRLCATADQAAQAAQQIAAPVVMKIDSPDIPHKSDAGGVVLNVQGGEAARQTYDQIIASVTAAHPAARINGVLVQEMVPQGLEIIAGFRNAPGFGPVMTIGLGGVLTEVLDDTATALAPVSAAKARAMLQSLRGARLLSGYRGAPPVDMTALSETIARLSQMAVDLSDEIAECDVNPIIALPDRAVAVDGLIILHKPQA